MRSPIPRAPGNWLSVLETQPHPPHRHTHTHRRTHARHGTSNTHTHTHTPGSRHIIQAERGSEAAMPPPSLPVSGGGKFQGSDPPCLPAAPVGSPFPQAHSLCSGPRLSAGPKPPTQPRRHCLCANTGARAQPSSGLVSPPFTVREGNRAHRLHQSWRGGRRGPRPRAEAPSP